eukprot:TRINITY_DN35496_c0_g1_i2.p1 TRINITY_DN35496_c0_g1~~TRINITY_DN35496_c0_g1_i2.p1  ORF type:complete len:129 (+),score=9.43 TRINITY_DN35496_c0_g1_i2:24-389(+)
MQSEYGLSPIAHLVEQLTLMQIFTTANYINGPSVAHLILLLFWWCQYFVKQLSYLLLLFWWCQYFVKQLSYLLLLFWWCQYFVKQLSYLLLLFWDGYSHLPYQLNWVWMLHLNEPTSTLEG